MIISSMSAGFWATWEIVLEFNAGPMFSSSLRFDREPGFATRLEWISVALIQAGFP